MAPGDIALADDTGVCFIPRTSVAEVLAPGAAETAAEEAKCQSHRPCALSRVIFRAIPSCDVNDWPGETPAIAVIPAWLALTAIASFLEHRKRMP